MSRRKISESLWRFGDFVVILQLLLRETLQMARRIRIKINSTIKKRTILKASDYCLDISKLILAGVVIAGVVDLNTDKTMLLFAGAFAVVAIGLLGFFFYILGNQSKL